MSTTLWLCEHSWVQTCEDCDFHAGCVPSAQYEPWEPNDCDQFTKTWEPEDDE